MTWARRAALAAALSLAASLTLAAQTGALVSRVLAAPAPPRDEAPDVVTARGAPRTFQVVAVPVPAGLDATVPAFFEVVPTGAASVLGDRTGAVTPGDARRVLLTIGVPAHAAAGRVTAARVRFVAAGAVAVVHVELHVAAVRRLALQAHALRGARAGASVELPFSVENHGNAADTLDVRVRPPAGWRAAHPAARVVLAAGTSARHVATLAVPRAASAGAYVVRVQASRASSDSSAPGGANETSAIVEVVDAMLDGAPGPILTAGVAAASGAGAGATAAGINLSGALTDDVQISAHGTAARRGDPLGTQALSRVGYWVSAPHLSLWAPSWQASAGATGTTLSELAGVNAFGRGVTGSFTGERRRAAGIGALAEGSGSGRRDVLAGAVGGFRAGPAWISGGLSHLADGFGSARRLDAATAALELPTTWDARATAEVGHRRFEGGSGVGWAGTLLRERPGESVRLRAVHAPGGSAAFARALTDLSASGARALLDGRVLLNGAAWSTRDANASFGRLTTHGWAFSPQIVPGQGVTLGLEARGSAFDARGPAGTLGNDERSLGASASWYRAGRWLTGSAAAGSVERSLAPPGGRAFVTTAPRARARASLGTASPAGLAELSAAFEQNGRGAGLLPRQAVVGGRVERVPVYRGVTMQGGAFRYSWFGDRRAASLLRAGATVPLVGRLALVVDVERNPFFVSSGGGWTVASKLERALRLPRLARDATTGTVYRDANANGNRDEGETGFAGAIVRRGEDAAVTDVRGRYRLTGRASGAPRLDPRSLPHGWLEGGASEPMDEHTQLIMRTGRPMRMRRDRGGGAGTVDIGVVPTTEVAIDLVLAPREGDSTARLSPPNLSALRVTATDAHGRAWWARVETRGARWVALFDALPPGAYAIEVDASGASEPLRVEGARPVVTIDGSASRATASVTLLPRPVRVRRLDAPPGRP